MNWTYLILLSYILILLIICLRIIFETYSSTKAWAYLFFCIFVPGIGMLFYLAFGINYWKKKLYTKKTGENDKLLSQLKKEIEPYNDIHHFPPQIKADKKHFPLSLIGYNSSQEMIFTKLVADADVDEMIESIFDRHPAIDYLHARNAEACCFICRIERTV